MGRHWDKFRAPLGTATHLHPRFHVVTAIMNPRRFRSRYELHNEFAAYVERSGGVLWTIECQLHKRRWAVTDSDNPHHIQVYSQSEIWHKEDLLNIVLGRLPADWLYVAWVDADVKFVRPDWVNETVQMLQHHQLVQMFSEAHDVGPNYEIMSKHESFMRSYELGRPRRGLHQPYESGCGQAPKTNYWHPGFAWAARREALDALGGLIDFGILGASDNHMACALVGEVGRSVHPNATPGYVRWLQRWQERAEQHIRRNVGYVSGTLLHFWHGKKIDRRYWDRWRILVDHGFDPEVDLKRDVQGCWQLVDTGKPRSLKLRNRIRNYLQARNEDSIDL